MIIIFNPIGYENIWRVYNLVYYFLGTEQQNLWNTFPITLNAESDNTIDTFKAKLKIVLFFQGVLWKPEL